MGEVKLDDVVTPELEGGKDLGTLEPEAEYSAYYSDQPIGIRVRDLFTASGQTVPSSLRLYDRFELWVVPLSFGLRRNRGMSEVVSTALEVEFDADGGTCSVVSMFPSFQYVTVGSVGMKLGASGKGGVSVADGILGATGNVTATDGAVPTPTGAMADIAMPGLDGLGVRTVAEGSVSLALRATVTTPIISVLGLGGTSCSWSFERQDRPLEGDNLRVWAIVALSKYQADWLSLKLRIAYRRRTLFFPTRVQGPWLAVKCKL